MIRRDRMHNNLTFNGNMQGHVKLPLFTKEALAAPHGLDLPHGLPPSCSAFQLAECLLLLPGQVNESLMAFEMVDLERLVVDDNTYFARASHAGLLQLVCQHFDSAIEELGHVIVRTQLGTFKFGDLNGCVIVRFNARERSQSSKAPCQQDFESLKRYAAGEYSTKAEVNTRFFEDDSASTQVQPRMWQKGPLATALWDPNLDLCRCVWFLDEDRADIVNKELTFTRWALEQIFNVLEQVGHAFEDYTLQGLCCLKVLSEKNLGERESMPLVVAACRWVLGGLAEAHIREASQEARDPSSSVFHSGLSTANAALTPQRMDFARILQQHRRHSTALRDATEGDIRIPLYGTAADRAAQSQQ